MGVSAPPHRPSPPTVVGWPEAADQHAGLTTVSAPSTTSGRRCWSSSPADRPEDRDPYRVYLGQLTGETLRTIRGCLDRLARILAGVRLDEPSPEDVERGVPVVTGAWVPWWELRYEGTAALRAVMLDIGWSPSHINKHLSALRRVLKESWRLGLMIAEDYHRAIDLEPVKAKREPAGRDVAETELDALLATCDASPLGIRDAAVIALVYVTGIRRSEAAALTLASYSTVTRSIRLVGKGNKERVVPVSEAALPWLHGWLRLRAASQGRCSGRCARAGRSSTGPSRRRRLSTSSSGEGSRRGSHSR